MRIAYHGMGYVGLTGAVHFAREGVDVIAYDTDPDVATAINEGRPKAGEFLGYLADDFPSGITGTSNFSDTLKSDIHILAVPTEKAGIPHMDIVKRCVMRIVADSEKPPLVIIESTLAPGTTDEILKVLGGIAGKDYWIAVAPRRDWFADPSKNVETLTRVVGGVTPGCTNNACEVLSAVSSDIRQTDYRTAEIVKALENALLHVQVMTATELALARPDWNVAEAFELASTHWRYHPMHLSCGTGGRCVPLGTDYLREKADSAILRHAYLTDKTIREAVAAVASQHGNSGVLVMGIAYRPQFADAGRSPGKDIADLIANSGGMVKVCDPMWSTEELTRITGHEAVDMDAVSDFPAVVLATPHKAFNRCLDSFRDGQTIIDGTGAWAEHFSNSPGINYIRVGGRHWIQ